MSDRAAREPLLSALGQADGAALSTVLGPRAPEFAARLARLDIAQRAGMRVLHGAERTVAVFPASYADQASRIRQAIQSGQGMPAPPTRASVWSGERLVWMVFANPDFVFAQQAGHLRE